MIRMKATTPVASLTIEGANYKVENGVIEVPPGAVRHALAHGFLLTDNGQIVTEDNLETVMARVSAAVELDTTAIMLAPPSVASAVFDGEQYQVENGHVEVPKSAVAALTRLGFKKIDDVAVAQREARGAHPTFAEYVAAGYAPESYPPRGYEAVDDADYQAELVRRADPVELTEADKSFNPDAATDDELKTWLKDHKVRVVGASRERMIAAIKKQLEPKKE